MRRWWRRTSRARRLPAGESRTPRWRSYSTRGDGAAASFWSMLVTEAGATPRRAAREVLATRRSSGPLRARMALR